MRRILVLLILICSVAFVSGQVKSKNANRPLNISLSKIVGIYQCNTDIIEGVHLYLMLNEKMVFIYAQGSSPDVLTDYNLWTKTGSFKLIRNKINFSNGKTFKYEGNGIINASSIKFEFIQSL